MCKSVLEDKRGYRARLEAPLSADERREARQLAENWQPVRQGPRLDILLTILTGAGKAGAWTDHPGGRDAE